MPQKTPPIAVDDGQPPAIRTMREDRLVVFHTMDPRGLKLGGIETHVRLILAHHPDTLSVLLVGVDESGDLALGKMVRLQFQGRDVDFLPVAHVPAQRINAASKTVGGSTTLRFTYGALCYLNSIRRAVASKRASCEIERFELAILPKLLRLPSVLIVHNEGTREDKMDSLLKRYWFLHLFNERIALTLTDRIFAVNESIATHIKALSAKAFAKTEVMSVSVDTQIFSPAPLPSTDDAFHVCFAGRLDDFKDPPLMFESLAELSRRLKSAPIGRFRRIVFDYVGATDPARFREFAEVSDFTVRHGIQTSSGVAAIMREAHAGIITSFFEGLPCYLLEMLASGRPVVAIKLPQFDNLIVDGLSGKLVPRQTTTRESAEAVADAFGRMMSDIRDDRVDVEAISALAAPFSVSRQMSRLFACHRALSGA